MTCYITTIDVASIYNNRIQETPQVDYLSVSHVQQSDFNLVNNLTTTLNASGKHISRIKIIPETQQVAWI